jgi:hypothetical protein
VVEQVRPLARFGVDDAHVGQVRARPREVLDA